MRMGSQGFGKGLIHTKLRQDDKARRETEGLGRLKP